MSMSQAATHDTSVQDGGKSKKKYVKKKGVIIEHMQVESDSEPETLNCEYCLSDPNVSVIECKKKEVWKVGLP